MNCPVCKDKIDRNDQTKIQCGDCKSLFHGSCANVHLADIEYLNNNNLAHRCDKCSVLRRKSLQQPVPSIPQQKIQPSNKQQKSSSSKSTAVPSKPTSISSQREKVPAKMSTTPKSPAAHTSHSSLSSQSVAEPVLGTTDDGMSTVLSTLAESSVTLQLLYSEILSLKKINAEFLSTMQQLKEENKTLRGKVAILESRMNWREQKQLENAVEIVGVPEQGRELKRSLIKH